MAQILAFIVSFIFFRFSFIFLFSFDFGWSYSFIFFHNFSFHFLGIFFHFLSILISILLSLFFHFLSFSFIFLSFSFICLVIFFRFSFAFLSFSFIFFHFLSNVLSIFLVFLTFSAICVGCSKFRDFSAALNFFPDFVYTVRDGRGGSILDRSQSRGVLGTRLWTFLFCSSVFFLCFFSRSRQIFLAIGASLFPIFSYFFHLFFAILAFFDIFQQTTQHAISSSPKRCFIHALVWKHGWVGQHQKLETSRS